MDKSLDIRINYKKKLLDSTISNFNINNNESDARLISKYKRDLNNLLASKKYYFDIEFIIDKDCKRLIKISDQIFEFDSIKFLLNNLIETNAFDKKTTIHTEGLAKILIDLDVIKSYRQTYYKSNSFEIFYKEIFKASYGKHWQEFSKL